MYTTRDSNFAPLNHFPLVSFTTGSGEGELDPRPKKTAAVKTC
jgi:hypothetical protein